MSMEFDELYLFPEMVPEGVCEECGAQAMLHLPTQTALVYCTHSSVGAYQLLGCGWKVLADITPEYFRKVIVRGLVKGELLAELSDTQGETRH